MRPRLTHKDIAMNSLTLLRTTVRCPNPHCDGHRTLRAEAEIQNQQVRCFSCHETHPTSSWLVITEDRLLNPAAGQAG